MGRLLETLRKSGNVILDIDFRDGSFKDKSGINTITKGGNPYIKKNALAVLTLSDYYKIGGASSLNVGLSDFSLFAKFRPRPTCPDAAGIIGDSAGVNGFSLLRVFPSTKIVDMKFDGALVPSCTPGTIDPNNYNKIAYTANRDGYLRWFKNGLFVNQQDISSAVAASKSTTGDSQVARYAAATTFNFLGDIEYVFVIKTLLTDTQVATLTSELEQVPDQRASSKVFSPDGTQEFYFKGEMGVLANETTITAGFLGNSSFMVNSGSFKMITETVQNRLCKVIECVTSGYLKFSETFKNTWIAYVRENGETNYTKRIGSKTIYSSNIVVDGNMEVVGVASWPIITAGTITKEASDYPGSTQCLRIAYSGTTNPQVNQVTIFTPGLKYRISGVARGDGASTTPRVLSGDASINWAGTTSNSWQSFSVEGTAGAATNFVLRATTSSAGYAEFDNIKVELLEKLYMNSGDKLIYADPRNIESLRCEV